MLYLSIRYPVLVLIPTSSPARAQVEASSRIKMEMKAALLINGPCAPNRADLLKSNFKRADTPTRRTPNALPLPGEKPWLSKSSSAKYHDAGKEQARGVRLLDR